MSNYSDRDIKAILSRAAELQQRSADSAGEKEERSLTLNEIEEIAREAGVSPDFVREAALEYEGIPVEEPLFLDTGRNGETEVIGFVKGKLDKRTWAELRSIIEYEFNSPGKVRRRPGGMIWEAQPKGVTKILHSRKSVSMEIKSDGRTSTIRIKKNLKTYDRLLLIPAFLFWVLALFMIFVLIAEEEAAAFMLAGLSVFAGEFFRRWNRRKKENAREHLRDVMEQLQTIIARRSKASSLNDVKEKASIQIEETGERETGEREVKKSSRSKERN